MILCLALLRGNRKCNSISQKFQLFPLMCRWLLLGAARLLLEARDVVWNGTADGNHMDSAALRLPSLFEDLMFIGVISHSNIIFVEGGKQPHQHLCISKHQSPMSTPCYIFHTEMIWGNDMGSGPGYESSTTICHWVLGTSRLLLAACRFLPTLRVSTVRVSILAWMRYETLIYH